MMRMAMKIAGHSLQSDVRHGSSPLYDAADRRCALGARAGAACGKARAPAVNGTPGEDVIARGTTSASPVVV